MLGLRRLDSSPMPEPPALPDPQRDADVRPLPVLAEPRPVVRREATVPAAAAAATGGFLLGLATFVLVRVLRNPGAAAVLLRRGATRGKRVEVAASRSFLIDIHLLKDR
jgi:hypothetical protein